MKEPIKGDILYVLKHSVAAIITEEYPAQTLSELSNRVIHDASIYQDEDSTSVAVLVYSLSKIIQACCEQKLEFRHFAKHLEKMSAYLSENNDKLYSSELQKAIEEVRKTDQKMRKYVQEVLERAKIKKGSKLHEHGISIARTAQLLGITQWELQQYVGVQPSFSKEEFSVRKRLETARELFQ